MFDIGLGGEGCTSAGRGGGEGAVGAVLLGKSNRGEARVS